MSQRVYEVGDELGADSGELLAWLQGRGHDVKTHMSAFPEDEIEAARAAFAKTSSATATEAGQAAPGERAGGTGTEPSAAASVEPVVEETMYRLVRKGSVTVLGVCSVGKGGTIPRSQYRRLPRRVRPWFDEV